jgi:hypothetical protein
MAKPILNCPCVVAGIRQCIAAVVPQHVDMRREIETGALANTFNQPNNRVRRERSATLSGEDERRVRE